MAKEINRKEVLCPKCQIAMQFAKGKYGIFLSCPNYHTCGYTHSVNQKTKEPLGTPADATTRAVRIRAHEEFDLLWKSGGCTRTEAYWWLGIALNIPKEKCHIGMFDEATCERAVDACKSIKKLTGEEDAKQSIGCGCQLVGQPNGG